MHRGYTLAKALLRRIGLLKQNEDVNLFKLAVFPVVGIWVATIALFGVSGAYEAGSAAEVIPESVYLEIIKGHEGGAEVVANLLFVGPTVLLADLLGRFVYAHLLWIPEGFWNVLFQLIPAAILVVYGTALVVFSVEIREGFESKTGRRSRPSGTEDD